MNKPLDQEPRTIVREISNEISEVGTLAPHTIVSDTEPELSKMSQSTLPQIPGFQLESELGRGGMGVVYLARQVKLNRLVALKMIISGDHADADTKLRFLAEAEAIAKVQHPGIVQVHEFGTHDHKPYFALEYISGGSLDKKLAGNPLPPKEAADLVEKLARAVQSAHDAGIIHRDLKPANILLVQDATSKNTSHSKLSNHTSTQSNWQPKITDFGLVKNVGSEMTATGQILGTPSYMAPEQADGKKSVGPAADIYALGAILYECLTGRAPFKAATPLDTLLQVLNDEPVSLRQLQAKTPMDLETICHKCLQKEPGKRYGSAAELAEDLGRYLRNEPIKARRVGRVERSWRWCKRYPSVAALVVVSVLSAQVASGLAGWAIYSRNLAEEARQQAVTAQQEAVVAQKAEAEQKTLAQNKEAEANAVLKFFEDHVLAAGRPKGQDGGLDSEVKLKDAVAASLPTLSKSFTDQPLIEARLRITLGSTFKYLGEYKAAAEQFQQARVIYSAQHGPDHLDTLMSMNNLAVSYSALGRHADALKLKEETLAVYKRIFPPNHPNTLASMNNLAVSYAALNRHNEALKLKEETLAVYKRIFPPDHPNTLASMNNLANSYAEFGRHADALKLKEETLAARKRVLPPDHPDTLLSMYNLANTYAALKRHADALKLYEQALAAQKRILPPGHQDTLTSMNTLADSYTELGRHADALKLREETLALQKRVLPPGHQDTISTMNNLAYCYSELERHADALKLREETLASQKRVLPPDHQDTLAAQTNLAISYRQAGREKDSLPLLQDSFQKMLVVSPAKHQYLYAAAFQLANCQLALGDGPAASATVDRYRQHLIGKAGVNPQWVPGLVFALMQHFQKANDPVGCRATTEMWEKLNLTQAASLYNAACWWAITAGIQSKTPGADAARLATEDADKAMVWLTKAIAAGYWDHANLLKDRDLDSLRKRSDFQKLLDSLSKSAATEKK